MAHPPPKPWALAAKPRALAAKPGFMAAKLRTPIAQSQNSAVKNVDPFRNIGRPDMQVSTHSPPSCSCLLCSADSIRCPPAVCISCQPADCIPYLPSYCIFCPSVDCCYRLSCQLLVFQTIRYIMSYALARLAVAFKNTQAIATCNIYW